MKKIAFIGLPGSGKTTIANELSKELNIPTVNIDQLFDEHPLFFFSKRRYRRRYEEFLKDKDGWIIDGYHGNKQPQSVWDDADLIVVTTAPKSELLKRVFKRYRQKKKANDRSYWQHTFINVIRNWFVIIAHPPIHKRQIERLTSSPEIAKKIVYFGPNSKIEDVIK